MKGFKIKIGLTILLVLIISGCGAVEKNATKPTSILWEVKPKSDTSKIVYLLGSIHIAPPELYPLNSVIMNAWNNSNALAVELNIMDMDTKAFGDDMSLVAKFISFTEKLSDKLLPDLYEKVKNELVKNGIPEDIIDMITPLGASILLQLGEVAQLVLDKNDGIEDKIDGIDMYFLKKANVENKTIHEVESLAIQTRALETLNEYVIPYLQSQIDNLDKQDADIHKLFTAWTNGDVKSIEKIINTPFTADKKINERIANALLYDRNIGMASKIEEYLKEKETYFVVLGAGHYVGNKSIIDILQKSGKYIIKKNINY